jgi:hypothetical protein
MTFNVPFKEAIDFHKQKLRVPTKKWDDITKAAHDRAFIVAGAEKDALLEDLHNAVIKSLEQGTTLADFGKDFDQIVAKHGWTGWTGEGSKQGQAWRKKIIYDTNLRTAYAAGRLKQMTTPQSLKSFPYWEYNHSGSAHPRLDHKSWDGKCLAADDPFWNTHYPPNGWHCGCFVIQMTEGDLKRSGKSKPDIAPSTAGMKGISKGFDYAPGKSWADGLVPKQEQRPLQPMPTLKSEPNPPRSKPDHGLASLKENSHPSRARKLTASEDTVDAFLKEFGATRDNAVLFRDVSGQAVPISEDLFKGFDGTFKGDKLGRAPYSLYAAEALKDPDEIWLDWEWMDDVKKAVLRRRYIRYNPNNPGLAVFSYNAKGWEGTTSYALRSGDEKSHESYMNKQRIGRLLWKRPKNK